MKGLTVYDIPKNLASMKRREEFIVFNPENINPIYFPRGGQEALDILESLRQSEITGPVSDLCPPELFDFFVQHALIVPRSAQQLVQKNAQCHCDDLPRKSKRRSVYLLLSHACNQACIYCLNGRETYYNVPQLRMTEEVAFQSLRTMWNSLDSDGHMEVVFFGGEPLFNWKLAKLCIQFCEEQLKPAQPDKTVHYHVTTNLTLFPKDLIAVAEQYGMTFLVDIDGPEHIHNLTRPFRNNQRKGGTFRKSAKNIRQLIDAGFKVALRATITAHNQDYMLEIAKTHRELGGSGTALVAVNAVDSDERVLPISMCPDPARYAEGLQQVYRQSGWTAEKIFPFNTYLPRLYSGVRENICCGAPFGNTPTITADGRIFSCIYLVGIKRFELGHIQKNDFPRRQVLSDMQDATALESYPHCQDCYFRYLCGGGCPVGRFSIVGNPSASAEIRQYTEEIQCAVTKTVLTELLWNKVTHCNQVNNRSEIL